jgi:tRNA threonylcarbamoyl adenosine modification protein YeaZ
VAGGAILAFDTATAQVAAVLLRGAQVLAARQEAMAAGQAERLFPVLAGLLEQAGLGWRDLGAVAVGTGPGSFTGVRIAVAAGRGLALALGIPAVGVTALEAAAFGLPRPLVAAIDLGRGELALARFDDPDPAAPPAAGPVAARPGELPAWAGGLPFAGEAAAAVPGARMLTPPVPAAEAIARIGAARLGAPPPRPAPLYLRPADALPSAPAPPVAPC